MVKFLRKLNRGVCLTFLVFLGLCVYIVAIEASRSTEKPAIESVCKDYIEQMYEWVVLPDDVRYAGPGSNINAYMSDISADMAEYVSPEDGCLQFELDTLKAMLSAQISSGVFIQSVVQVPSGAPSISYDNERVYVQYPMRLKVETVSQGEETPTAMSNESTSLIVLTKIDGQWKVVFSQIASY